MTVESNPKVFISYSHDDDQHKEWVLQLATRLRSNGIDIILDRWNLGLGQDVASFMEEGLSKSHRVICICSENYVAKADSKKGGVGYEKRIITGELVTDQSKSWIIPLVKNNASTNKTPLFLKGQMYISFEDARLYEAKYEELLRALLDEPVLPIPVIGRNPFKTIKEFSKRKFISSNEKYVSPATSGTVSFDYSNNNGRYFIGQGELLFECAFSKGSNNSIYIYNDPASIHSIACVKDTQDYKTIKNAMDYDSSSRVRTISTNQIAILQNENGFYAVIKIISIKDDTRGSENDEVVFEYFIQTNGSPDFTF